MFTTFANAQTSLNGSIIKQKQSRNVQKTCKNKRHDKGINKA